MTHSENEPTPPAGGGRSTDAIWYYEKIGAQPIGPVTEESIKLLLEAKTIYPNTRVWNKSFGKEWKAIKDTELYYSGNGPPPLLTDEINNIAAWLIAVTPLLVIILVMTFGTIGFGGVIGITFILYGVLFVIDQTSIKRSGREPFHIWNIAPICLLAILFVPAYQYNRAERTGQSLAIFWTSIVVFIPFIVVLLIRGIPS